MKKSKRVIVPMCVALLLSSRSTCSTWQFGLGLSFSLVCHMCGIVAGVTAGVFATRAGVLQSIKKSLVKRAAVSIDEALANALKHLSNKHENSTNANKFLKGDPDVYQKNAWIALTSSLFFHGLGVAASFVAGRASIGQKKMVRYLKQEKKDVGSSRLSKEESKKWQR